MTTPETVLYTTVDNHEIRHQPSPELRAFLARLAAMVDDPGATENDMIALGYSRENPLLAPAPAGSSSPDRGWVTREVFENPSYRVMHDLLWRKQLALGHGDIATLEAEHDIPVADAAVRIGISESAVRQAIAARRLGSWMKGGRHFLSARGLDVFERTRNLKVPGAAPDPTPADGPRSSTGDAPAAPPPGALRVHVGHKAGASMKLCHPGLLTGTAKAGRNEVMGTLATWSRVAVLTTEGAKARLFVLEPEAGTTARIEHEGFFVEGPFRVVEKVNNAAKAREAWAAFEAA